MDKATVETRALQILCWAAIALTVIACALVPHLLARYRYEAAYIGPIYAMALAFIVAVWQLRAIVARVAGGQPFSRENVANLRRIGWCCFAVSLAALGMLPIYFSFIKIILAALAATGGLAMRVLAHVFLLAARQKEEMDLVV